MTNRRNLVYGLGNPLQSIFPEPIKANRAPSNNDIRYEIGQVWVDTDSSTSYILSSVTNGVPNWETNPGKETETAASPTDEVTINSIVMSATFTGFTTAADAELEVTINNSSITTSSALLVTVSNLGTNDAQMTLTRVEPKAGSVDITMQNLGTEALNGDVRVNIWRLR